MGPIVQSNTFRTDKDLMHAGARGNPSLIGPRIVR